MAEEEEDIMKMLEQSSKEFDKKLKIDEASPSQEEVK